MATLLEGMASTGEISPLACCGPSSRRPRYDYGIWDISDSSTLARSTFMQHLLSPRIMPGRVLHAGDTAVAKAQRLSSPRSQVTRKSIRTSSHDKKQSI